MVEITFVRHGQAQTGAPDEHSYDHLSDLGRQQADWLGQYMAECGHGFDHVISGTLNRQRDTAQIVAGHLGLDVSQDARLNEMDYFGLSNSLKETHALDIPDSRETFVAHVPQVLSAWQQGQIHSHLERFDQFQTRVHEMIAVSEDLGGRVMLVTSGGVISMAMRLLLQFEVQVHANILLQIFNTSIHRYVKTDGMLALETFNAVPHLDLPSRQEARTRI
ncbi:histidine phosphatase family protein [Actibacterium sp. XHP0104]|uniref:histidine phosphatase family protein n=1 Tax=Actibacterium sp. XHP0104 TaxID=2984335 RepID=UPI0021E7AD7E|nr:histidine phosphatase family protein [Actibacterium sp. XHP0104]MCV2880718.1 histidine phosphatase family protein [Actibacterium sp. XHP0104]